jgi:Uma2 family endonuclease
VLRTGLATYPDATVVSGPTVRDPDKKTNVTNPRVLVEVTSDATEDYDRGEKLTHYQQVPSLEAVVIVSHREPRISSNFSSGVSTSSVASGSERVCSPA